MSNESYTIEKPFQFSGKMAKLLGEESVSSDVAALFELVKNAYDADASQVFIRFRNFGTKAQDPPFIEIEDFGNGMTLEEIENHWLVIGTYAKDKNKTTKKGRRVVGNKGIGRFATQKLASKTTIISKPEFGNEQVEVEINWKDYEAKETTFNDIKNILKVTPNRQNKSEKGTKIILKELRDASSWTKEKMKHLMINISTIIPPQELAPVIRDSFSANVDAPDFGVPVNEDIPSILFEYAPFKLISIISENSADAIVELYKKGQKVISQKRVTLKGNLQSEEKWKSFGKCKLILYFYPRSSRYEDWDRWYRVRMKISDISEHIDELVGVKLYRDGFWVRPYGEKSNDWLGLEQARVQSNLKVGNSQSIGFVEITKDGNPDIVDTTTRERIVENIYFESLQKFVNKSIDVLSRYRIDENKTLREFRTRQKHQNKLLLETKYLINFLDKMAAKEDDKNEIKHSLKDIQRHMKSFEREKNNEFLDLEKETRTYRNLASLGISSATTSHEIKNIMTVVGEILKSLQIKIKAKPIDGKKLEEDRLKISEGMKIIRQFLILVGDYVINIKDDFESLHEISELPLSETLEKMTTNLKAVFRDRKINITLKVYPDDLTIFINQADFFSLVLNLLTNAIKAVSTNPKHRNKEILVTAYRESHDLKMLFSNNGPTIKENEKTEIFNMFISKYEEGTGLGLPIVKEIVEEYDGKISVSNEPEFKPGATFKITIPMKKVEK